MSCSLQLLAGQMDGLKSQVGVSGGLVRYALTDINDNEIEDLYHSFTLIKISNILMMSYIRFLDELILAIT